MPKHWLGGGGRQKSICARVHVGLGPVSADGQPARNSFLAHGALFDLFALCSNFVLVSDGEREESERVQT